MSVRIRYEGKGGKPETMVVGSQDLAERVAKSPSRTRRSSRATRTHREVAVTTCPPAARSSSSSRARRITTGTGTPSLVKRARHPSSARSQDGSTMQGRLYGGNVNDLSAVSTDERTRNMHVHTQLLLTRRMDTTSMVSIIEANRTTKKKLYAKTLRGRSRVRGPGSPGMASGRRSS